MARELGDPCLEAQAAYSLATAYTLLGDFASAVDLYETHLNIATDMQDVMGECRALTLLASGCLRIGNFQRALDYATRLCCTAKRVSAPSLVVIVAAA